METDKKTWVWVVVAIVVILIGFAFYASYKARNTGGYAGETSPQNSQQATNPTEQTVNIKHQYANGTHTYAGSIDVPTPCDTISYSVVNDPTDPTKFTLAFVTVPSTSTPANACAQVVTSRSFKLSFTGPQNANVSATLDGAPIILNVFEIPAGQNIDSDLYIKG